MLFNYKWLIIVSLCVFQKSNCAEDKQRHEDLVQAATDARINHEDALRKLDQIYKEKTIYYQPVTQFFTNPNNDSFRRRVVFRAAYTLTSDASDFENVHGMLFKDRDLEKHRQLLRDLETANENEWEAEKKYKNLLAKRNAAELQAYLKSQAQPTQADKRLANDRKKHCAFYIGY